MSVLRTDRKTHPADAQLDHGRRVKTGDSENQLRLKYPEGVMMRNAYGICFILLLIACGSGQNEYSGNEVINGQDVSTACNSDPIEISEWTEYLQSSDTGLWEDDPERIKVISSVNPMYCDLDEIQVFSPYAVCCYSDTIFVTDASTCEIVALKDDGSVIWRTEKARDQANSV